MATRRGRAALPTWPRAACLLSVALVSCACGLEASAGLAGSRLPSCLCVKRAKHRACHVNS